jgi:hypothetical protein
LARGGEDRVLALRYRVAKKQLLAAAAGSTGSPVCMCVRCVCVVCALCGCLACSHSA